MHWFTKSWWQYLLAPKDACAPWLEVIWCRAGGHKCGVIYVNAGGEEPDMHCKNCGDYLG